METSGDRDEGVSTRTSGDGVTTNGWVKTRPRAALFDEPASAGGGAKESWRFTRALLRDRAAAPTTRMQCHASESRPHTRPLRKSDQSLVTHASIYIPSLNANKQQERTYAVSLNVQDLITQSHPPSTIHSRPRPPRMLSYLAPSSISQHQQSPYHGWGCPDHFRILAVTELDEWVSDGGPLSRVSPCRMSIETIFSASRETRLTCLIGWTSVHLECWLLRNAIEPSFFALPLTVDVLPPQPQLLPSHSKEMNLGKNATVRYAIFGTRAYRRPLRPLPCKT